MYDENKKRELKKKINQLYRNKKMNMQTRTRKSFSRLQKNIKVIVNIKNYYLLKITKWLNDLSILKKNQSLQLLILIKMILILKMTGHY